MRLLRKRRRCFVRVLTQQARVRGAVARGDPSERARDALWVRVGLEQAGQYHIPLLATLREHAFDVVLFNSAQVSATRRQDLLRSLKSDARDLGAMADLLLRGKGHRAPSTPLVAQATIAAQRARKVDARRTLKNQTLKPWTSCSRDSMAASRTSSQAPSGGCCSQKASTQRACANWGRSAPDPSCATRVADPHHDDRASGGGRQERARVARSVRLRIRTSARRRRRAPRAARPPDRAI